MLGRSLVGTLFIFVVVANLSGVLPGIEAPTSKIETPAALALIVFFSVHYFGVREDEDKGVCQMAAIVWAYLKGEFKLPQVIITLCTPKQRNAHSGSYIDGPNIALCIRSSW